VLPLHLKPRGLLLQAVEVTALRMLLLHLLLLLLLLALVPGTLFLLLLLCRGLSYSLSWLPPLLQ
jgi:hypothetical protein